jgi:hypothetical protein
MYESIGKSFDMLMWTVFILLIIFIPLGLWKLVEIIIWLFENISISIN